MCVCVMAGLDHNIALFTTPLLSLATACLWWVGIDVSRQRREGTPVAPSIPSS